MNMNDNSSNMLVSESIVDELESVDAIIFDCDGVLVDITESYDTAINETVSYILKDILDIQANTIVTPEILWVPFFWITTIFDKTPVPTVV